MPGTQDIGAHTSAFTAVSIMASAIPAPDTRAGDGKKVFLVENTTSVVWSLPRKIRAESPTTIAALS
jgi:hypothetical protein